MPLTIPELEKLASLSRLRFEADELAAFGAKFENILSLVAQISTADTQGVQPLTSTVVNDKGEAPSTPERADTPTEPTGEVALARRAALQAGAPATEMGFFVVPKIVE